MQGLRLRVGAFVSLAVALVACDSLLGIQTLTADGGPGSIAGDGGSDGGDSMAPRASSKVDLLFMISNNASMSDSQSLLALALPQLVTRLVSPNCVGNTTMEPTGMTAGADGNCGPGSTAEFFPVHDLHIGILSSSLGGRGGDVCPDNTMNPVNQSLSAHDNDQGHLLNRGGVAGDPTVENVPGTPDAPSPLNFLSYFPSVPANADHTTPPTPPVKSSTTIISDFTTLVEGVHSHGCGFSGQNEAWYRFLVQPDPFTTINKTGIKASISGVDETILQQRATFLRPDSLLAVIVVTDNNDRVADPLELAGQGWAFEQASFPGSPTTSAPEGSIECRNLDPNDPLMTGPNDPNCMSCSFLKSDPNFATRCPKDGMIGTGGYLDPNDDALNLRFWHQKERFGIFSGYPTSRYVRGLQQAAVPSVGLAFKGDTDHEHDGNGNYMCESAIDPFCTTPIKPNCVNPIYAQNLPTSASSDLCHLTKGPRTPDLVYYAAIAGVPHQLLQAKPGDPECPSGTPAAQCPQKNTLSAADWKLVMGTDPEHYDFRGTDYHMIQSNAPRTTNTGLWANVATSTGAPSTCQLDSTGAAPTGCDPVNGAEFDTKKYDLEFACTFPLVQLSGGMIQSAPRDCTQPQYQLACDCASTSLDVGTQLCDATTPTLQVNGRAYPSIDEMIIANAMATEIIGGQTSVHGVVSSICPITVDVGRSVAQAQQDPLFGYNPAINPIINGIKKSLAAM